MFDRLTALFDRGDGETVHECRRCGTTVEPETDTCPNCERETIVRHRIR